MGIGLGYKKCSKCEQHYPANTDFFNKLARSKDGLDYMCKECKKEQRKKWNRKPLSKEQKNKQKQQNIAYRKTKRGKHIAKRAMHKRRSIEHQVEHTLKAGEWEECLQYFNYKDAYTGLPLTNESQDHIIPITFGGGYIKENIIPCNRDINSSKGNKNMLVWYKQQIYFDEDRLERILNWMGDYKKYLYVPLKQLEYIDFQSQNSIQYYKVTLPNGSKRNLYYTSVRNKAKLTMLVKQFLLKDWEEYCQDHWIWFGKIDPYTWNYEDRVKSFLSRCADFILIGNLKHGNILTEDRTKQIYDNEIPLSSTSSQLNDCVFSSASDKEYTAQARGQNIILANEILLGNTKPNPNTRIHKSQLPNIEKNVKDSQYYKLKQLYKTDDIRIFKLHKLKNKDINYTYWKDSTEKFPEVIEPHNKKLLDKKTKESMCAKDYKKLANKPFRNLHGENLYEYRPHTIKGNKKGIIDRSKPYKWEWSYVWADNVFEFDGSKYRIDDSVEQYQGKLTKMNRKKVPDMEVRYEMDKILVFEQDGKRYYFDQKIDRIDNDLIHAI